MQISESQLFYAMSDNKTPVVHITLTPKIKGNKSM